MNAPVHRLPSPLVGTAASDGQRALVVCDWSFKRRAPWQELLERLALPDTAGFVWDARRVLSGDPTPQRGPSVGALARAFEAFVRQVTLERQRAVEDVTVLGHGVGAVIVATWVHDYAPRVRAVVLAAPGFRDPIPVNVLAGLRGTSARLLADAAAIHAPTLLLDATADRRSTVAARDAFFARLASLRKVRHPFEGPGASLLTEPTWTWAAETIRRFLNELEAGPVPPPDLLAADASGYTYEEFRRLQAPGGPQFAAVRWIMRTLGKLSHGIALGWETGFDSGLSLDYVYRNQPAGRLLVGRFLDRVYLESVGWRGIRQRRLHLVRRLSEAIVEIARVKRPVEILDIAAGGGRYVLETVKQHPDIPVRAYLQDYREENLEAARALREAWRLPGIEIARGDAWHLEQGLPGGRQFDIGVVSGFYELRPDNAPVLSSLRQLAARLRSGGLLLYTNQPWHPQIEFIARVLRNHEGRPWIMRRRTQLEMDQLVAAAGFTKKAMDVDDAGIFSVSVARR